MVILKPGNLQLQPSTKKLFEEGSTADFGQAFSYLLQFLRAVREHLFYRPYLMAACEIGTKTDKTYQ